MNNTVTSAVEAAAVEAALADGLIATTNGLYAGDEKSKKAGLRRGKWTTEEELYANRLIYEFKLGLLPLTDGTTLRTFLSKLLNCDPMRISKKFVGQNCIGKQVFRRRQQDLEKLTPEQIETSRRELAELERRFLERVAQTNRVKSMPMNGKDGRADYEDENGHPAIPPWVAPPAHLLGVGAQPSVGSSSDIAGKDQAIQQHSLSYPGYDSMRSQMGGMSSVRYLQQQQQQSLQDFHATFPAFQQQMQRYHNGGSGGGGSELMGATSGSGSSSHMHFHDPSRSGGPEDATLPRVTSLDVLNTIAQFNSPSGSTENLAGLGAGSGSASALKQQQLSFQQQHGVRRYNSSGSDAGLDMFPGLVGRANSSTLTLGDSVGWGSFSNFNTLGAGGSMDDLLAAGLYGASSASMEAMAQAGQAAGRYQLKPSSLGAEEGAVGYPLDDAAAAAGSSLLNLAAADSQGRGARVKVEVPQMSALQQMRVRAPIVDLAGLTAVAHLYQPAVSNGNSGHGNESLASQGSGGNSGAYSGAAGAGNNPPAGAVRSDSLRSTGSVPGLPKNGSVEDFWMLVNMGDLPQPEQDVLSQNVWSPVRRSSSAGPANQAAPSLHQQRPPEPAPGQGSETMTATKAPKGSPAGNGAGTGTDTAPAVPESTSVSKEVEGSSNSGSDRSEVEGEPTAKRARLST